MGCYAYLFEVKSIQNFLFAGEKLKDMIIASEVVASLTDDVFTSVKGQVFNGDEEFNTIRSAGGALYLTSEQQEKLLAFQSLFDLVCCQIIPNAQVISTVTNKFSTELEAVTAGLENLAKQKNITSVDSPLASPITTRSQRTGKAGVGRSDDEVVDYSTRYKRSLNQNKEFKNNLVKRFGDFELSAWPSDLEDDVFGSQKVAIIHADGNGLGLVLRELQLACSLQPKLYRQIYSTFSKELEAATIAAAQSTSVACFSKYVENSVIPARPLILGGDDITIIVRADLALEYANSFIANFEHETAKVMSKLQSLLNENGVSISLKDKLTACAGIVYLKKNQPFSKGYSLAESACALAKEASVKVQVSATSEIPSSLSFIEIQSSLTGSMEDVLQRERTIELANSESIRLTPGVYGLNQASPHKFNLTQLASLTQQLSHNAQQYLSVGKLRRLLGERHQDPRLFAKSLQRLNEVANKHDVDFGSLLDELKNLETGSHEPSLWADVITCAKLASFDFDKQEEGTQREQ